MATVSPDPSSYLTVARDVQVGHEVKRSRFLATLARVEDEEQARVVIDRVRREHPDAGHHCTAFALGADGALQRSSDDGEPAGTAGAPMLDVLRGAEVSDTIAVVSRWFGGVLLGAGGLARAYGDSVRAALAQAGTLRRSRVREVALTLDHADAARLETELRARGVSVLEVAYTARVRMLLGVGVADEDRLAAIVAELTGGGTAPEPVGERWIDG